MWEDFKKFTLLQKVLVVIDLILNPKAINYPFLYQYLIEGVEIYEFNIPRHLVIKKFIKDGMYHYWCIRWV